MPIPPDPSPVPGDAPDRGQRLDSWKEIAAHLKRDVRTVQRWEKTAGLPVRRLQNAGLRAVFAYTAELDEWLRLQGPIPADAGDEADEPDDDVQQPAAPAGAPVQPQLTAASPRRWWLLAAAALIVAVAALALWPRTPAPFGPLTSRPITADPGSERDPDISPDGQYVVYASVAPNLRTRILVRLIEGGEPRPLTAAPEDEWSPAWSHDGARIAFLRGDPSREATLLVTAALGGTERTLATVRPYAPRRTQLIGHLLDWTPDGRHVVVPDQATPNRGGLVLIDVETGARSTLTTPGDAEFDVEPTVSSDGRLLLFNRVRGEYVSDAYVQALGPAFAPEGPLRKLQAAGLWNGTPRLLEQRDEVITSSGTVPRLGLWRQPLDGSRPPESLGIIGDYAVQTAVHQPTGRIVSRTYRTLLDVLRYPVPDVGTGEAIDPPTQPFLESTFIDRSPAYAPDGSAVAFISDRRGRRQLWVSNAEGEAPAEWTQPFETDLPPPAWSPDGSKVSVTGLDDSGVAQLFVIDRASRLATRVSRDAREYGRAVWSPDRRFLYAAAAVKGIYTIVRVPAGGGPADDLVTTHQNVTGAEPTGKGLYLTRTSGRLGAELDFVPLPAGTPVHLASLNFAEDAWVTREGVYYLARRADGPLAPVALTFRSHTGVVRVVQEYTRTPGRGLSVSADGRFALSTRVTPPNSDLFLLDSSR